jgi:transcriptional regulator of acetoin/glycerol metabolism
LQPEIAVVHDQSLQGAWEEFARTGEISPVIRPLVARSWLRSRALGLNPYEPPERVQISAEALETRLLKRQALIRAARPFMLDLFEVVRDSEFLITLADEDAVVLESLGDPEVAEHLLGGPQKRGYILDERHMGTTGLTLVQAEKRPLQVLPYEHYRSEFHRLTCSVAPIFDPRGRMLGMLNLTGAAHDVNTHTLGLVIAGARAIENEIRLRELYATARLNEDYALSMAEIGDRGLIYCDRSGNITKADTNVLRLLHMTAEQVDGAVVDDVLGIRMPWAELERSRGREWAEDCLLQHEGPTPGPLTATIRPVWWQNEMIGARVVLAGPGLPSQLIESGPRARHLFDDVIFRGETSRELVRQARALAGADNNILLTGPVGSGKKLLAQAIHNESSRRAGPFVVLDCQAADDSDTRILGGNGQPGLFIAADGGTLYLKEIGYAPAILLKALMRLITDPPMSPRRKAPVSVRIISATSLDLNLERIAGRFSGELYNRLAVSTLALPSLTERREDIGALIDHYLPEVCRQHGRPLLLINPLVLDALRDYAWPGNVRELRNVLGQAVALSHGPELTMDCFPCLKRPAPAIRLGCSRSGQPASLEEVERMHITSTLEFARGNVSQAAAILGLSRNTLYAKMQRYGLGRRPGGSNAAEA